jgi:hypothetical protein
VSTLRGTVLSTAEEMGWSCHQEEEAKSTKQAMKNCIACISAEIKIQPFAPHHTPLNQANLRSAWLGFFVKKI